MPELDERKPSFVSHTKEAEKNEKSPNLQTTDSLHLVSELGWTPEQAAQIRASLQSFDEDWNAPGMEAYDRL